MPSLKTEKRKGEHVEITRTRDVEYCDGNGLGDVRFIHCSLPELDFDRIDTRTELLGKKLKAPFIITGMTGGYPEAERINNRLAAAAEEHGVAFGLGSQRAMIEDRKLLATYKVRKSAPTIPIIANIGVYQLKRYDIKTIRKAIDDVDADALAVHLNPLQEVVQVEGDRDFSGCLKAIQNACSKLDVPVIAKETGAGISRETAHELAQAGVKYVDVSGTGGTSWSKVEYFRKETIGGFGEWGNPTARCICECSRIIDVFATGGIRNGVDAAKGLALGAKLAGAALPFIRAEKPGAVLELWKQQLKCAMFLARARNLEELASVNLLVTGHTAEALFLRGIDAARYANRRKKE